MPAPILLDLPATLNTERLELRPPRAGDGPMLCAAVTESLPELRRFVASLPWAAAEHSVEASEAYCRQAQANFLARSDLPFLLIERSSGELVGCAGLHRPVWSTPQWEVGYWCRSSRTGQGFIAEAVRSLSTLAFETLRVARLELLTDADNPASRRVAERCGFELEGILRHERRAPGGELRNTCVYARIAAPA